MIRKITVIEKLFAPKEVEYTLEHNDYKAWLTEDKFRQLALESISLLDDLLKEKWDKHFGKMKGIK